MKFKSAILSLLIALVTSNVDGMSIRGNTKSANKLMTFARRLDDSNGGYSYNYNGGANNGNNGNNYNQNGGYGNGNGYNNGNGNGNVNGYENGNSYGNGNGYGGQYGEMQEEAMYFLNDYSIKLLSCIQGEQVINYENGELESSTVIFRLCPSDSCDANSALGCDSGYGDFAVGINTFLEAYMEQQQENQNNYGNGMMVYNQYGQEFNAEEYMECREYNMEEGENQNQQQQYYNQYQNYNNGNNNNGEDNNNGRQLQNNNYYNAYGYNQNAQFFIGPGCSADGTTVVLGMYMDEFCSYPAEVSFSDIAYGWESGLPFSDGGLVSMNCVACYGPDQNYNWELSKMCSESYQFSTSRCEQNMTSYSYYGQNTQGCDYISNLVQTIYGSDTDGADDDGGTNSKFGTAVNEVSTKFMDTLSTREARAFISTMVLFCLSMCLGASLITCFCAKKRKERKRRKAAAGDQFLPENHEPSGKRRSSVVALVRSTTNNMAESVRSAATGAKMVVATAAAKSVASIKKNKDDADTVDTAVYKDMEDPDDACKDDSSIKSGKTNKSIKSRMSSIAAKTAASIKSISTKKKVDNDVSTTKSDYNAPEPIAKIPDPAIDTVPSTKSSAKSVNSKANSVTSNIAAPSSAKSVNSKADPDTSNAALPVAAAAVAAVGVAAAAAVAAPLITKDDASTKSETVSVKSTKSSDKLEGTDPAPVPAVATVDAVATAVPTPEQSTCPEEDTLQRVIPEPESKAASERPSSSAKSAPDPKAASERLSSSTNSDTFEWIFGGCMGDTADKATDDSSLIPSTTQNDTPSEPTLVPTAATTSVTTSSPTEQKSEVTSTELENEVQVENEDEEEEKAKTVEEIKETPSNASIEVPIEIPKIESPKSSSIVSQHSEKTEKTKGKGKGNGGFLSKMDSHLKKKLSKKS